MHLGVNLAIDKVVSNSLPNFSPVEVDYYLNRAVRSFCRQTQLALFEGSFVSQEDVRTLLKVKNVPYGNWVQNPKLSGSWKISVPHDLYLVTDFTIVGTSNQIGRFVSLQTLMEVSVSVTNRLNTLRQTMCTLEGGSVVFTSPWSLPNSSSAFIGYMRAPAKLSIENENSCDLPEHVHDRIVTIAVDEIMTDIKTLRPFDDRN